MNESTPATTEETGNSGQEGVKTTLVLSHGLHDAIDMLRPLHKLLDNLVAIADQDKQRAIYQAIHEHVPTIGGRRGVYREIATMTGDIGNVTSLENKIKSLFGKSDLGRVLSMDEQVKNLIKSIRDATTMEDGQIKYDPCPASAEAPLG